MKRLLLLAAALLAALAIIAMYAAPRPAATTATPTPLSTITPTPTPTPTYQPGEAISDTTSSTTPHGLLCENDSYLQSNSPAWLYIDFYMPHEANATLHIFQDRAIREANFTVSTISKAAYEHGTELDGVPEHSQLAIFRTSMEDSGGYITIPLGTLTPENNRIYLRIGTPLEGAAVFQPCRIGSDYPPYLEFT